MEEETTKEKEVDNHRAQKKKKKLKVMKAMKLGSQRARRGFPPKKEGKLKMLGGARCDKASCFSGVIEEGIHLTNNSAGGVRKTLVKGPWSKRGKKSERAEAKTRHPNVRVQLHTGNTAVGKCDLSQGRKGFQRA